MLLTCTCESVYIFGNYTLCVYMTLHINFIVHGVVCCMTAVIGKLMQGRNHVIQKETFSKTQNSFIFLLLVYVERCRLLWNTLELYRHCGKLY